jgi:hypothetical protein
MSDELYVPISSSVPASTIWEMAQDARQQTDGVGLRVGKKAEFTLIAPLTADGAVKFRERAAKIQAEAAYWEGRLGTVHDLRVALIGETHILFAATYSDDFKPYVLDVIKFATPWIDHMFLGIADGFPGLGSPDAIAYIAQYQIEANVWYASNPDLTVRDISKAANISKIFNDLLDAAQS